MRFFYHLRRAVYRAVRLSTSAPAVVAVFQKKGQKATKFRKFGQKATLAIKRFFCFFSVPYARITEQLIHLS